MPGYTLTDIAEKFDDGVDALENTAASLDQIVGALAAIREVLEDICNRGRLHVETHPAP